MKLQTDKIKVHYCFFYLQLHKQMMASMQTEYRNEFTTSEHLKLKHESGVCCGLRGCLLIRNVSMSSSLAVGTASALSNTSPSCLVSSIISILMGTFDWHLPSRVACQEAVGCSSQCVWETYRMMGRWKPQVQTFVQVNNWLCLWVNWSTGWSTQRKLLLNQSADCSPITISTPKL